MKEELAISLGGVGDVGGDMIGGSNPHIESDGEGYMAKQNLWKIAEYAQEMHDLIHDDEDLEPWVEEKIAVAAYMMDSVGHHMQYEKMQGGEGEHEMPDEDEYLEITPTSVRLRKKHLTEAERVKQARSANK